MIVETKEVYKCEYCRKLYQVKGAAERHELLCSKNPINDRICFGCSYLSKKDISIDSNRDYAGPQHLSLLYCSKIKSFLYPPKVEAKGEWFDLGDESNEPMRRKCEYYDDNILAIITKNKKDDA